MERYVDIATSAIYTLASIAFLIYSFWKARKAKKEEETERLKRETIDMVTSAALEYIQKAEEFKNYTGEEKFNWVLTRLKQLNQNIYGETELGALINKLVGVTKNVNAEKKGVESNNGGN